MDSTVTPEHSLASLLAAIDKDAEPLDSPSHQGQEVPERSGAERIPQPPPVEKECVSEDHTIKVTTVDNRLVKRSGRQIRGWRKSLSRRNNQQRYEYATSASVIQDNATSASATQDNATSASATQEYATSASAAKSNEATSAPTTQKDDPESAPATQNHVRQSASPTFSLNDSKTNVSGGGPGRGRVGSTPAKQRTSCTSPARPGASRRAVPKQPAPLPINPNDGQDNEDDEMAEIWRYFAIVIAQTKAKKSEQIDEGVS
ncbi:hypothetical protein R1sor_021263 [Riccia sorocarpa]|uniref:Uncharacterized protein n=1 Tax=Riccia sorocarpa TaxID=122646 RepID=A0ABD3GJG6_9MARC